MGRGGGRACLVGVLDDAIMHGPCCGSWLAQVPRFQWGRSLSWGSEQSCDFGVARVGVKGYPWQPANLCCLSWRLCCPQAFDTVGWLDLTAAKVRFGLWLGGVMPTFTPWEQVFDRRPAGAPFGAALPAPKGKQAKEGD
jgi:hypothetical protein